MTTLNETAPRLAAMSRELIAQGSQERLTLQAVVDNAVQIVPAAEHCSVLLRRRRGRLETEAATSELARTCDDAQLEAGEGPCWDVVATAECAASGDLAGDRRWTQWGPRAAAAGVHSAFVVRLASDNDVIGALAIYSTQPSAFGRSDADLALIFTATAVQALSTAREATGLKTAIPTRHLIGVAQGVLMARYALTMDQAFQVLRRYSNDANLKLRDVAALIVAEGGLPQAQEPLAPLP